MGTADLYRADFRYDRDLSTSDLGPLYGAVLERVEPGWRVLEVGCHTGYFSRVLRDRGCQVMGIEINAEAAAQATAAGLEVLTGSVEDPALLARLAPGFDALLLMDVLEHLVDPWSALARLSALLRPEGRALISLPNVACWTMRSGLLRGRWQYTRDGLLDRTHLRFFTFHTAGELIRQSGFTIEEWLPVLTSVPLAGKLQAIPLTRRLAPRWTATATRRFPNLCAAQLLFQARRDTPDGRQDLGRQEDNKV